MQNNLTELWALLHFLAPDIFTAASADCFSGGFDPASGRLDPALLEAARRLLDLFMLRRLKSQVAVQLPGRKEVSGGLLSALLSVGVADGYSL